MNPICRKKKGLFKGNKVFLEDRNGRKKQAWFVPFAGFFGFWFFIPAFGLSVKFKGKNSTITLGLPLARFSKSKISVGNNSKVEIKSSSDIVKKLKISMADWQKCTIGRDFFTWETEIIFSIGKDIEVNIGDDCMFSKGVLIRPSDGHTIYDISTNEILNYGKSINIGHHIWCAGDNSILKGANIPNNSIVAKGSIVTKAFDVPNSLYAGIPAKIIKTGVNWRRKEPDREDVLVSKEAQKIDIVYLWCDLADEKFKKKKEVKRPNLIVFEKENVDNDYANFELKIKPRISIDEGFPQEAYQLLAGRRKEMLEQIEEIIFSNYLDEDSEDLASEIDSFPDIRYFTGNYYVVYESYGFIYRDSNYRPYHIKDGQYRNVSYKGNERKESYLPLDSDEIKKYYKIFIQVGLTGNENGQEEDYMSLDLVTEIASPDDEIEFEVLSHGVM